MFFFSICQHGLQPCPINHDKLIRTGFIGFGDKKFFFVIFFFSRQMKHLKSKNDETSQLFDPTLQWGQAFQRFLMNSNAE